MNSAKRLEEILNDLHISANKFAKEIGYTSSTKIQHVRNGRNDISAEVANDIVKKYPEYNYEWVFKGAGNKYVESKNAKRINNDIKSLPHAEQMEMLYDHISKLETIIEMKDQENEARIKNLVDVLAKERNAIIDVLRKAIKEQKKESI